METRLAVAMARRVDEKVSVTALCEELGISRQTFYVYFRKVRQPLKKIMVVVDKTKRDALKYIRDVILDEVNIKELIVLDSDSEIVNKSAKANFK